MSPWWIFAPTLDNYVELLTSPTYLTFFRNSALVSVLVVLITMAVSIPAAFALSRMKFWGSATLATGVFLTYLIPARYFLVVVRGVFLKGVGPAVLWPEALLMLLFAAGTLTLATRAFKKELA